MKFRQFRQCLHKHCNSPLQHPVKVPGHTLWPGQPDDLLRTALAEDGEVIVLQFPHDHAHALTGGGEGELAEDAELVGGGGGGGRVHVAG